MPDNINRSDVEVDFKDIYGDTITDKVEIKIYNTQLKSLKDIYNVSFKGEPVTLEQVPAFPTGHARMIVTPTKYRFKQRFINVQAGETNRITEYFFVEPSKANPHPIEFADLAAKTYGEELLRILKTSKIGALEWNRINQRNRAMILNLCAKMSKETTKTEKKLITFVESIHQASFESKNTDHLYALVNRDLLAAVRDFPESYINVDGSLQTLPEGWRLSV